MWDTYTDYYCGILSVAFWFWPQSKILFYTNMAYEVPWMYWIWILYNCSSEWYSNLEVICAVKEQIEPWFIRTNTLSSTCTVEGRKTALKLFSFEVYVIKQEQKQSLLIVFGSISALYFHEGKEKDIVPFVFHTDMLWKWYLWYFSFLLMSFHWISKCFETFIY